MRMAPGLDALIKAADFLEQQEKLKLSPQQNVATSGGVSAGTYINNDTHYVTISYENGIAATTSNVSATSIIPLSNNIINMRNGGIGVNAIVGSIGIGGNNVNHHRYQQQQQQIVSSSAPAAAALFQRQKALNTSTAALTITSNGNVNSQLQQRQLRNISNHSGSNTATITQDFEVSNGSESNVIVTTSTPSAIAAAAIAITNGGSASSTNNNSDNRLVAPISQHSHAMLVDDTHIGGGANVIFGATTSASIASSAPTSSGLLMANNSNTSPRPFQQQVLTTGNTQQLQQQHQLQQSVTTTSLLLSSNGGGSQMTHVTPTIGGSGRRRTISSNSNGAGTREVHNKLEKNRRAHLKECYEALKNELPLKDDDRKKTSNLAILGEAHKLVNTLKKEDKNLELESEQLSKAKISLQKRLLTLRRDMGAKYEDSCDLTAGIILQPDKDCYSNTSNERDHLNDSIPLSSRRGSMLYGSTSSISSGGSSNTTAMSSPINAGTTITNAISPVITNTNSTISAATPTTILATSPHSTLSHLKHSTALMSVNNNNNNTIITNNNNHSANNSPTGSPIAATNVNAATIIGVPLSLTAKNISATATTRGSPTPSTPSPSSSSIGSSSGVSSSSSPPIGGGGGVINGRSVVAVNIPNGTKFPLITTSVTSGAGVNVGTIITTSPSSNSNNSAATIGGVNSNNAHHNLQCHSNNKIHNNNNTNNKLKNLKEVPSAITSSCSTSASASNGNRITHGSGGGVSSRKATNVPNGASVFECDAVAAAINGNNNSNCNNYTNKTNSVAIISSNAAASEDGEQPTKFLKVYNGAAATPTPILSAGSFTSGSNKMQLSQIVSNNGTILVSPTYFNSAPQSHTQQTINSQQQQQQQLQKIFLTDTSGGSCNGSGSEIGRLPGGAELNILPNTNNNNNGNGMKQLATFYHANGKLTLMNTGGTVNDSGGCGVGVGGVGVGSGLAPLFVATTTNQYTSNFAQLIASSTAPGNSGVTVTTVAATSTVPSTQSTAAAATSTAMSSMVPLERLNGKFRLLLGAQQETRLPPIKQSLHHNSNNSNNNNNTNDTKNKRNNACNNGKEPHLSPLIT